MMLTALALREAVRDHARELGFARVAIGPATPPEHGQAFERWLDAGHAGSMDYLHETRAERLDPALLLRGVHSVIAVALSYAGAEDDDPSWAPVARYARGADYHDVMRPRLQALATFVRAAAGPGTQTRVTVDNSAALERDLAARAGLGWIGKNTNLLDPGLGSYFLIGLVFTTASIEADGPVPDRCGVCTACLDACPTRAFVAPYVLDARRCISYLTIEYRGEIPELHRDGLAGWVFGCDVCQEVCPWNRKAAASRAPELAPSESFPALSELLELDEAGFRSRFKRSPLWRAKRSGLLRNAALAIAGSGRPDATAALQCATTDADEIVRGAATWALHRAGNSPPVAE
jgi:epoxyqueuosine reductase